MPLCRDVCVSWLRSTSMLAWSSVLSGTRALMATRVGTALTCRLKAISSHRCPCTCNTREGGADTGNLASSSNVTCYNTAAPMSSE